MFDSDSEDDVFGLNKKDGEAEEERLTINKKFAKRFEATKKKQELNKLREVLGDDEEEDGEGSDTDSSDEDEDAEELTPDLELKILQVIKRIRNKDPTIYKPDVSFFEGEQEGQKKGKKKEKGEERKTFKDVVREQVVAAESGRDVVASSDEEGEDGERRGRFAYDKEQEELRKSFLNATAEDDAESAEEEEDDDDDDLLRVRERHRGGGGNRDLLVKEVEETFGRGDEEADRFLRDFVMNRRWAEREEEGDDDSSSEEEDERREERKPRGESVASEGPGSEDDKAPHVVVVDDEQDEEELDRMDAFESSYNFRFEQDGGTEIRSYARNIDGLARRKDDKRKKEREAYKARKAAEKAKKAEELRRLKNLKKDEIRKRLDKIKQISGGGMLDESLLEEEFDPDKWEQQMQKAFGEDYYDQMEDDWAPGGGNGDEEDGGWGGEGEEEEAYPPIDEEEFNEDSAGGDVRFKKLEDRMMEELYQLDYEDLIEDIPCRFKYKQVEPNDFGLTTEEILEADDAELNRLVSLKKFNPYRDAEYSVKAKQRKRFREALKQKKREEAAQEEESGQKKGIKRKQEAAEEGEGEAEEDKAEGPTGGEAQGEKKKGKKRRKKHKAGQQQQEQQQQQSPPQAEPPSSLSKAEDKGKPVKAEASAKAEKKPQGPSEKGAGESGEGIKKKKRRKGKRGEGKQAQGGKVKAVNGVQMSESRLAAYGF